MSSINKVILVGRLGKDPEIRSTQDGRQIANLTVATSEGWKDKNSGERKEKTEWHRVVVFNDNLIKVTKDYLKKGSLVYFEGALQTRKWQKDGKDYYATEVVLQNFGGQLVMLTKDHEEKKVDKDSVDNAYKTVETILTNNLIDETIPF